MRKAREHEGKRGFLGDIFVIRARSQQRAARHKHRPVYPREAEGKRQAQMWTPPSEITVYQSNRTKSLQRRPSLVRPRIDCPEAQEGKALLCVFHYDSTTDTVVPSPSLHYHFLG